MKIIRSAYPSITDSEIFHVNDAIRNGWGKNMNNYSEKFSKYFSRYVGKKFVLNTSHCTAAIHLALIALNIKKGDEVIVPDFTWVASVSPILYVGAKPVFADIDPKTLCLSAKTIKKCITKKTKAVIVVDLYGNMPDWDEILTLCKKNKIRIIEDAAESLGAKYKNKKAGKFGVISVFSFNATKLAMSGQGGCLCTDDIKFYEKAKLHSHHGLNKNDTSKYFWSDVLGYQYNWTNIQAALAYAQMKRINSLIKKKKDIYRNYKKLIGKSKDFILNESEKHTLTTNWISYLNFSNKFKFKKEKLIKEVQKYKIDLRPIFYPLSSMPTFQKYVNKKKIEKENYYSYKLSKMGVCLPSGNDLTYQDQAYVIKILKKVISNL
jgi:perosamine synthetase